MEKMHDSEINYCLKFFFAEARKRNGDKYPPKCHIQTRKRSCTIDFNTEEQFWNQNALGDDNPEKLKYASSK